MPRRKGGYVGAETQSEVLSLERAPLVECMPPSRRKFRRLYHPVFCPPTVVSRPTFSSGKQAFRRFAPFRRFSTATAEAAVGDRFVWRSKVFAEPGDFVRRG